MRVSSFPRPRKVPTKPNTLSGLCGRFHRLAERWNCARSLRCQTHIADWLCHLCLSEVLPRSSRSGIHDLRHTVQVDRWPSQWGEVWSTPARPRTLPIWSEVLQQDGVSET